MLVVQLECDAAEDLDRRAIAARLRGVKIAEIESDSSSSSDQSVAADRCPPTACSLSAFAWIEPHELAASLVTDRLRAGQHVVIAGVPRWKADEWQRLIDAARGGGAQLAVVNSDRYLASRQLVRQQIGGPLGTAGLVRIHAWQPAGNGARNASECRGLPAALVSELDIALWLIGEQPTVVYACESKWADPAGAQGRSIQVHLGFDEAMALVDCEVSGAVGTGYRSLSVIGSSGAAYVDDQRGTQLLFQGGPPQAVIARESRERQLAFMIQDFADAIAAGRDLTSATLAWNDVFAVAEAVQHSIATHQAVKFAAGTVQNLARNLGRTPA